MREKDEGFASRSMHLARGESVSVVWRLDFMMDGGLRVVLKKKFKRA